jgi:hypothetical protein
MNVLFSGACKNLNLYAQRHFGCSIENPIPHSQDTSYSLSSPDDGDDISLFSYSVVAAAVVVIVVVARVLFRISELCCTFLGDCQSGTKHT